MSDNSNFAFLKNEWPELHAAALKAESFVHPDARAACFYARRALELSVSWLYQHDSSLKLPYQDHLNALIHEPTFKGTIGPSVLAKVKVIQLLGNLAVHSKKPVLQSDALNAVRELFHFCFWLARTYTRDAQPPDSLTFDADLLPKASPVPPQTVGQLQKLAEQLSEKNTKLTELLDGKAQLDAELERLRAEIAKAKKENAAHTDKHDYSEAATRDYFIDLLLKEAGWPLDKPEDREYPVTGMPNQKGAGFIDYVLWAADGKPLALVEAKRTKRDPRIGQQQAKLYADCLEKQFGQRPIIFYSNGYDHWIWDNLNYPPRPIQGFLKKPELELLIQRRTARQSLKNTEINRDIVERHYQERAIRRISEAFEKDHDRKALVVMATGAGKTRTVIALCDLLMRCNWVKRVLFLADRVALVNQAVNAFKRHLPASSPVNLVTEKDTGGRVYVSTYPTMIRLIDETSSGQRKFGPGHFDLVIIDEAHRSVYQKYRAIFEYFDSFLVGLTATPKDEVDRNTYSLFELESGVPTDFYDLEEAVKDGFLVPAKAVSVPLKFQREGIRYDQLSEDEKDQWDALEWNDEGTVPQRVEPEAVNKWLFNKDTVDKVLEHVMTRGLTVAGGDRLGKTIVFAKGHTHAEFIADRFNANYPHYRGEFARVIDFEVKYVQSLIDSFSHPDKAPHIAISVDMLDTGIDIPEVVNLVFFKIVRSKTKFWQMVGRGTRLRKELFGHGKDKQYFYIFDYCQNLEYFSQNPEATDGASGVSLGKRLFISRLELIGEMDRNLLAGNSRDIKMPREPYGDPETEVELRYQTAEMLRNQVASMNVDNFIVRPKRRIVERYRDEKAWVALNPEKQVELVREVAGLPSELVDDDQDAKQFDLLILRLQLSVLRAGSGFETMRDRVRSIAGLLEEKSSIPMVRAQMVLIQEVQSDEFWQDITISLLEKVRRRLRALIKLIEKTERKQVYSDFEDEMGEEVHIGLPGLNTGADYERFLAKARLFLRKHEDHITIHKLRLNKRLTSSDLAQLEEMLIQEGVGTEEDLDRAKKESKNLAHFVRSLVGLDREAAKKAFDTFLKGQALTANQIEFVNLIVDHLTENGVMDKELLYQSPFIDYHPMGVEGLFNSAQVTRLISILDDIGQVAVA